MARPQPFGFEAPTEACITGRWHEGFVLPLTQPVHLDFGCMLEHKIMCLLSDRLHPRADERVRRHHAVPSSNHRRHGRRNRGGVAILDGEPESIKF